LKKASFAIATISAFMLAIIFLGFIAIPLMTQGPQVVVGPSSKPCVAPTAAVAYSDKAGHHVYTFVPATVSIQVQVFAPNGTQVEGGYVCNKLITNSGLAILAALIGDKSGTYPVWMTASNNNGSIVAGTSVCPNPLTTNGFTVYDGSANYAYTSGSTYTAWASWTYTGVPHMSVSTQCLSDSSTNAASSLVDGTLVGPYMLQTNYLYKTTVTITV
jgi:hypothetical protein